MERKQLNSLVNVYMESLLMEDFYLAGIIVMIHSCAR